MATNGRQGASAASGLLEGGQLCYLRYSAAQIPYVEGKVDHMEGDALRIFEWFDTLENDKKRNEDVRAG
jgi:hypothetical protein